MEVIKVEQILTEEELEDLFTPDLSLSFLEGKSEEPVGEDGRPGCFGDNHDEWAKWIYKQGYRIVKIARR